MDKENIFDAGKQENQSQDKSADELLSEENLDKVAGGEGEFMPDPGDIHRHDASSAGH